MNDIPYWAHKEKEDLSPEKRKEVEAEAERMYKEYKEQCKWGRKRRKPKAINFNPYNLNFDFIESIPEDEWKELIEIYIKQGWLGLPIGRWIMYGMGILLPIQFIYYVLVLIGRWIMYGMGILLLIQLYYYIRGYYQE
jgi:hypothetical protein